MVCSEDGKEPAKKKMKNSGKTCWGNSDEGWKTHLYSASNYESTLSEDEQVDAETCLEHASDFEKTGQPYDLRGVYEDTWRLQRQFTSLSCQEQMKKFPWLKKVSS